VAEALGTLPRRFPQVVLAALQAAEGAGPEQEGMVEVLGRVYEETVLQLRAELPAAVRLVDLLCTLDSPGERLRAMAEAVQGGRSAAATEPGEGAAAEVPPCHPSEVVGACRHLLADLEGAAEVADRVLVARVCLVREEARLFADRLSDEGTEVVVAGGRGTAWPSTLPQLECAFIAELLKTGRGERRGALLVRALSGDLLEFSASRRRLSEADLKRMAGGTSGHEHAGHEHAGHEHAGHEHAGHEHAGHEHAGHEHAGLQPKACGCPPEQECPPNCGGNSEGGGVGSGPGAQLLDAAQSEASIQAVRPGRLLEALMALEGEALAGLEGGYQPGGAAGTPSAESARELTVLREEVLGALRGIASWKDVEKSPLEAGEAGR